MIGGYWYRNIIFHSDKWRFSMLFLENIGMGQNWKYEYRAFLDHGEAMMTVLEDSEKKLHSQEISAPPANQPEKMWEAWISNVEFERQGSNWFLGHLLWIFILSKWETSHKNQKCCAPNRVSLVEHCPSSECGPFLGLQFQKKNPVAHPTYPLYILSGWWLTYPSEKYEFVSWDYDIPNWMEK